jgi:hypothetical protein
MFSRRSRIERGAGAAGIDEHSQPASQPFKRARSPSKQSGVLQGLSLNLFRAGVVAGPIF